MNILSCSRAQIQSQNNQQLAPVGQVVSESDLNNTLEKIAAESLGDREGAVLVIDPQNGRLRAVVNPRLAFEQAYPPGSAIKPFTALAALRAGIIDRETRHQCQTRYVRDGFEIVCSHPISHSPFNLTQSLAYSCNNFFAHVGERLSEGAFNSTLSRFGFGEKSDVNANEIAGELPRGAWSVREALGESEHLLVTPVQLLIAYTALVNGGHLYRPRLTDDSTMIPQEKIRLNIAPDHREAIIEGMRGSVKYGTSSKAGLGALPIYVFGKTGTSTSSVRWRTQGWFVGFAADKSPTGAPHPEQIKLGVLVFLKKAHGAQAAEIAKPILDCGLRIADCGLKKVAMNVESLKSAIPRDLEKTRLVKEDNPQSAIRNPQSNNPQSIRVRSISENIARELPLEEYLAGVLAAESSVENEPEALKAQAVISRSFALKNRGRHAQEGYDFCSTTHCQRFTYIKTKTALNAAARRAVEDTAGLILLDPQKETKGVSGANRIVDAYFHAACGGMTANIETLWGAPAPYYLRGVRDDFCATMPHRRWIQRISAEQLAKALQNDERTNVGPRLDAITVTRRDETGRAEILMLEGARRRTVRGWDFKIIVGRSLGWQMIKSSRFEVSRAGNEFVFLGGGFGHGLGLCQEGAHVAARRGMSYRQILNHYFPGTRLNRIDTDRLVGTVGLGNRSENSLVCASPFHRNQVFPSPAVYGWVGGDRNILRAVQRPSPRALAKAPSGAKAGWQARSTGLGYQLHPDPAMNRWAREKIHFLTREETIAGQFGLPLQRPSPRRSLSSEHFRANFPANADDRSIETALRTLETARRDLIRRLEAASMRLSEPGPFEVVVHTTTADFIAATGQSGWAAGATRGRRIELQPLGLLRRRGVLNSTLRHEFTHAVVEALGGGRAPRWLAEGLAIYVAGEMETLPQIKTSGQGRIGLSREELERKLARPTSAGEARKLYAMAYHEVRALIESEGEAGVWRRIAKFKEAPAKQAADISPNISWTRGSFAH